MALNKEKQAIELGKIWMKNSVSKGHGYEHAEFVEENALNIFKSMKKEAGDEVDESLVSIAAWWHDAYKARLKKPQILNFILEGFSSAKIVEKELKGLVGKDRLEIVLKAIRYHHLPVIFYLTKRGHSVLSQILIEADGIEDLNSSRKKEQLHGFSNPVFQYLYRLHNRMMILILKVIAVSEYTKGIIQKVRV